MSMCDERKDEGIIFSNRLFLNIIKLLYYTLEVKYLELGNDNFQ